MAGLNFKYGLEQSLQTTDLNEGTIYITTDKHSMYCDLKPQGTDTVKRFRIGDFLRYNSLDELKDNHDLWNRNSLVYIDNGNVLAAYDETEKRWIQINDTSTLSNTLTERMNGLEGRIKDIEDDYVTKADLEAEQKARTDADTDFDGRIGTLENKTTGFENTTIKKYVDDQIGSINNSDSGILAQANKYAKEYTDAEIIKATNTIDSTINGLQANIQAIDGKITQETQAREAADTAFDGRIGTLENKTTGFDQGTTIKGYIDGKIGEINHSENGILAKAKEYTNEKIDEITEDIDANIQAIDKKIDDEIRDRGNAISDLNSNTIAPLATKVSNLEKVARGYEGERAIATAISGAQTNAQTYAKNYTDTSVAGLVDGAQTINTFKTVENEFASVRSEVKTQMQTADAMTFKGVLSETVEIGNITYLDLPTTEVQKGDTYKISKNGAIIAKDDLINENDSITVRVGDLIIAGADQGSQEETYKGQWYHISSGYEDDYNAYFIGIDKDNKLELKGGAGEDKGSITFVSDNIQISMTSSTTDGVNNSELAFSLVWGTF